MKKLRAKKTKMCKNCGIEFEPKKARQVVCAKCKKERRKKERVKPKKNQTSQDTENCRNTFFG